MFNSQFAICKVVVLLGVLACHNAASAQEFQPPEIISLRLGLADQYKVGLWTQAAVTLRGGSEPLRGEVSIIVSDGEGMPSRVVTPPDRPCCLLPGKEQTVRLLCRPGRVQGQITAEFRVGGELYARRTFSTAAEADADHILPGLECRNLVVTIGRSPLGIESAGRLAGLPTANLPVEAQLTDPLDLPVDWLGYEGVDAVIISTTQPELFASLSADSAQLQALDKWVRMGGRLVLCCGEQAAAVCGPNALLNGFMPGRFEKIVSLRQTAALENYCGSRSGIPQVGGRRKPLLVPRLVEPLGVVEAREADLPLVIRTARGFGQVIFLAADIDCPPLADWSDRPMLLARLLDIPISGGEDTAEGTAMMHFGYTDLAGQLRSALDHFDGVRLVPFWLVATLIIVYLAMIGPGDYFLLRKLIGCMRCTWATFPVLVVLASLAACVLAHNFKGNQLRGTQIDLVDFDTVDGLVRGTTWVNLFSPKTATLDLTVTPTNNLAFLSLPETVVAWLGLPGSAIGGMNPRSGELFESAAPYQFAPKLDAMLGTPIRVWSSRSFTARWKSTAEILPQVELTDIGTTLYGRIANTLGVPWEQCILAYGRSVYELGNLAPDQTVEIGPMSRRSELKTLLTGRKVVFTGSGDKYQQETTPYDQSSADAAYILRQMMFYEAAGGRRYSGLWNAYQGFVDLSSLLLTDRAILVAHVPSDFRAAFVSCNARPIDNSNDKHITLLRFVFPVKRKLGNY